MVNRPLLALGVVFLSVSCCQGYRYGPIMSACGHMFPVGHGYDARNDTPPFTFYVNQTAYSPNDTIEDTVFPIVIALERRKRWKCKAKTKVSAIRHYSHLHVYNKTFTWTAPSQPVGHVYFRATVARNREKFWTNVFSVVIEDPTDSNTDRILCPVISKQSEVASSATTFPHTTIVMITMGLILYCL